MFIWDDRAKIGAEDKRLLVNSSEIRGNILTQDNDDFTFINNTSTTLTIAPALDDDDDDFTAAAKIDGGSSTAGTTTMVMEETKSPSVPVNQTGHHHGLHHLHVPKLKKLILSDKVEEKMLLECVGALK